MPAVRATSEVTAPGSSEAATIRSFSARDHRGRRCTDVTTSTCVFVIVLVLGLLLGLHGTLTTARRPSPDGYDVALFVKGSLCEAAGSTCERVLGFVPSQVTDSERRTP